MTVSRLDLDGVGSTAGIAARIHELDPDLPLDFSIEALCKQLDIVDIQLTDTTAFEAALIMDELKAAGSILLAKSSNPKRRRFSIGHELGHFLIPTHMPRRGEPFTCSHADLRLADTRDKNRHKQVEAEANRFAAQLLMPPKRVRASLTSRDPDLAEVVRLAHEFGVSKEAMARSYAEAHRQTLAVIIVRDGRIERLYRPDDFPWVEPRWGDVVPAESIASAHRLSPGEISEMEECEAETWLGYSGARKVEVLSEQVLAQQFGYATILLHAELADVD
ncbi:IrrE N-terminal-like domain-containing protein [Sphingomonas antarctica]|uniref:ImmA/IrrE family metallo-endopeptidase n=1 Tax=Sphingomonas antarctica TaxID=2040274 RepID=UPI0039E93A40